MNLSLGIALVAILSLTLLLLLWLSKLTLSQTISQNSQALQVLATSLLNSQVMNQTLVNLLASKDPMTFQSLQAVSPSPNQSPTQAAPISTLSPNLASTEYEEAVTGSDEEEWVKYQKSQGLTDTEIEHLRTDLQESGILNFG